MKTVTLVDYGLGNLYSIVRALEKCGASVRMASRGEDIRSADRLILPGVGAFASGLRGLQEAGLQDAVLDFAGTERPLLGICLGMQLLLERSSEFGNHIGLGLIRGEVLPIPTTTPAGAKLKSPHIGWANLQPTQDSRWEDSLLRGTRAEDAFYHVHSFHAVVRDAGQCVATCDFGGNVLTSAIRAGAISGCQFHPEKSGVSGLRVLVNFMQQ